MTEPDPIMATYAELLAIALLFVAAWLVVRLARRKSLRPPPNDDRRAVERARFNEIVASLPPEPVMLDDLYLPRELRAADIRRHQDATEAARRGTKL